MDQLTFDLLTPPMAIRSCPACGRRIRWEEVRAYDADGRQVYENGWHSATCPCGLELTWWHRPPEGDEEDA